MKPIAVNRRVNSLWQQSSTLIILKSHLYLRSTSPGVDFINMLAQNAPALNFYFPTILNPTLPVHSTRSHPQLLCCMFYARGGQSAARGPHAALQRFSAAPVSNFWFTTKLFMTNLCIKYPKFTSVMWSLGKKNKAKKFCGPKYNILMKFGPSEKKSGHPCSMLCANKISRNLMAQKLLIEHE